MRMIKKLLKIPTSVDEVVERAQRTGEVPEIIATRQFVPAQVPNNTFLKYELGLRIGRAKIIINKKEWSKKQVEYPNENAKFDSICTQHVDEHHQQQAQALIFQLCKKGIKVDYGIIRHYPDFLTY